MKIAPVALIQGGSLCRGRKAESLDGDLHSQIANKAIVNCGQGSIELTDRWAE